MKKLFSLFTLLIVIVMGAWADDASWKNNTMSPASYFTLGSNTSAASNSKTIGDVSYTHSINMTSKSNQSSNKTNGYYIQFTVSSTSNFNIVFGANGGARTIRLNTGWTYDISTNATQIANGATPAGGIKATSSSVSNGQFGTLSGSELPAGTYYICGSGSVSIYEISITSAGPVDPVFELSADEVEVGKTISVTGPAGLTFNATAVEGTTGAVSVDGGTITGVTAGAAQVRVTSAATDDYNAYDNTFDITVTAAKIATELSFGTPTTTVARGEEVTNAATLTAGGETVSGTVTYSSDNESVATVDATGKVTGVKVGTANIKANFAGDATYSAAEEISYAITVTLPALTPVSNKIWTVKDAALLAEYPVNNSTKTKDITATNVIDNMEIVATSSKKMTMAYNANAATHADLPEGLTYRFQTLGMPGSDSDARYLHFKAAANSKVSAYFIQGTAGVNVAGYSLGTLDSENPTGICTNTAGDTGKMVFATGDTETDVYLYSASEGNSKGVQYIAVKVEPAATASVTLNAKGFATYSSDCAFAFSGAKAYKMALNESAKTMVGTEVNGEIAAGEGILFKGEAGATVTITLTSGAPSLAGNSLKGSTQADGRLAEKPEFCYALSGDTFKTFTGDALFANKAFFATENAIAQSFDIVFEEGEATAVDAIAEADEAEAAPVKVIKNGKLYIGNFNVAGQQVK